MDQTKINGKALNNELNWLKKLLDWRMKSYFGTEAVNSKIEDITAPTLDKNSSYANLVRSLELDFYERILLITALAPYVRPQVLDVFFIHNATFNRGFSEFGGVKGQGHGGFLPTGETIMFLLAGKSLEDRFRFLALFDGDHILSKNDIVTIDTPVQNEPFLSGRILVSREYAELLTSGKSRKPNFSKDFPAKLIETELAWGDLVLPKRTFDQIEEVKTWITYGDVLMDKWGLRKKLRPGIRVLFHGPPGTGKTMTSCLLGKHTGRDVYRIDLSMVISKYIGETEENLGKVFNQAENKNWILFFDEADALFGSRTQTESANDMFANQQVSYLLQRIEDFNGVIILSTNMKNNIDKAFIRRFETMVYFTMPSVEERLKLWTEGFSKKSTLEDKVNLKSIASEYELTGGVIMNIVRYSSLLALKRKSKEILLMDIMSGIKREFIKEGKTL